VRFNQWPGKGSENCSASRCYVSSTTRGGALAMHRLETFGTVEKGKQADLLVVAADPAGDIKNLRQIRYVIKGGVVRAQSELRSAEPAPPARR
jgi:cytosine/adenosine deaminase-related metal-dependent hydrolase